MPTIGGCVKGKHATAVIVVLAIVVIAIAWRAGKLNRWLPEKLRRHMPTSSGFIGLTRQGLYTMGPGGEPGVPGIDLNTSTWV
jgi:hypothetical protein